MEEEFVGYLLNALDPVTHRRVERYLADHPECAERLELLRQALQPLDLDSADEPPPPRLADRTLAFVAAHSLDWLPQAPPEISRGYAGGRGWWRRSDVLVAASIALFILFLAPPVIAQVRKQYQIAVCKNNLAVLGQAQLAYSDLHQGKFPNVADEKPPFNVAGMVVPVLFEAGVLDSERDLRCPGDTSSPATRWPAGRLKALPESEFVEKIPFLSGSYAYSLGYRQDGTVRGLRRDDEQPQSLTPLMADSPLLPLSEANSGNHGGGGQNVLYMDGHVAYCTHRLVGYARDDIFRSVDNKVGAGLHRYDSVLGQSAACP
jgi:prepilin-type processing-associated H-X9-DG protein